MRVENKLTMITTPIFNEEIGERLKLIRMKNLLDQKGFGKLLGLSAKALSDVETGKTRVLRSAIPMAKFQAVLGDHSSFVFYGTGAEQYNKAFIVERYWKSHLARSEEARQRVLKQSSRGLRRKSAGIV